MLRVCTFVRGFGRRLDARLKLGQRKIEKESEWHVKLIIG